MSDTLTYIRDFRAVEVSYLIAVICIYDPYVVLSVSVNLPSVYHAHHWYHCTFAMFLTEKS